MSRFGKKKITQSQIAREAGVSQTAVSAILSGSTRLSVSEETRNSVLAIAEKLDYVIRKSAPEGRNGANRKQNILIVEAESLHSSTNEAWIADAMERSMGRILTALGRNLQPHGISLSVFRLNEPQKLIQWLGDSGVDGVLWHAQESHSTLLHWVASRFPLVLLNREWNSPLLFDSVTGDQKKSILIPSEHLWKLGHRKIAVFGHVPGSSVHTRRMAAYREFVTEKGVRNYSEFQEIPDTLEMPALEKVSAILKVWKSLGSDAPTAMIMGDIFALPLLRDARKLGIEIPRDLSIVGIDNTSPCSLVEPQLSSMEEPYEEMCRVAVDLLFRRKANPKAPSQSVQIAPSLVIRQSARFL